MVEVRLCVYGTPEIKQRPRVVHGGKIAYTPDETLHAENLIAERFMQKYPDFKMLDCALSLECDFWMPDYKRKDSDNLAKLVMDALNHIAYEDDSQIIDLIVHKHLHDRQVRGKRGMRAWHTGDEILFDGKPIEPQTDIILRSLDV